MEDAARTPGTKAILRKLPRYLAHTAMFVIVVLSIGDIGGKKFIDLETRKGEPASAEGLPFMVTLHEFTIDYYPGTTDPLQYTSKVAFVDRKGVGHMYDISVNHPARIGAWAFYQADFEKQEDGNYISILECVRDPLYPGIRICLWLLMAAALLVAAKALPGSRLHYLWVLVAALFVAFVWLTMDKVGVGSRNLMPALHSPWFVPHIVSYMFAYAAMTAVTIVAVVLWIRSQKHEVTASQMKLCDRLVRIGWAFMTLGMCMGALWAKEAWGDWWSWDPKETWALITWAGYGAWFHLRPRIKDPRTAFAFLIFDFLLLQMCWYGVNYLPSMNSLHTY